MTAKPVPDLPRAPSGALSITAADKKSLRYDSPSHPVLRFPLWVGELLWNHAVPQSRILSGMVLFGQLADLTNNEKGHTFARAKYLADRQRVSVRTLWRCIKDLEELALIEATSQGQGEVTHFRVLRHPRQNDYFPMWLSAGPPNREHWGWTDLIDYALRGHGDPHRWSDEVHDQAQSARMALRPVADRIDVVYVVRRMDEHVPPVRRYGSDQTTAEESERLHRFLIEHALDIADPEEYEAMFLDAEPA